MWGNGSHVPGGAEDAMSGLDYDVLVIGSGFGGSVAALRLTEKGYRVGVLEAGRRFDDPADPLPGLRHSRLPKTSWRINLRHWSERTVIALVMQSRDNSITVRAKRGRLGWGMRSVHGHGEPNPVWIPTAHRATRLLAEEIGGTAFGAWTDLFNIPMTAHFL